MSIKNNSEKVFNMNVNMSTRDSLIECHSSKKFLISQDHAQGIFCTNM